MPENGKKTLDMFMVHEGLLEEAGKAALAKKKKAKSSEPETTEGQKQPGGAGRPASGEVSADESSTEMGTTAATEKKGEKAVAAEGEREKSPAQVEMDNKKAEIKEKRREVYESVKSALRELDRQLAMKSLSSKTRQRYEWVKQNMRGCADALRQGDGGKIEGTAVDELLQVIYDSKKQVAETRSRLEKETNRKKQLKTLAGQAQVAYIDHAPQNDDERQQKLAYETVYRNLPDVSLLKMETQSLVRKWESADIAAAKARGEELTAYDEDTRRLQTGEALRQLVAEYTNTKVQKEIEKNVGSQEKLQRHSDALEKLDNVIKGNSTFNYEYLYGKGNVEGDLTPEQERQQKPRTEAEVGRIAGDQAYRDILLERFEEDLPEGFDTLQPDEQNMELAKLALQRRRILVLPKYPKVEVVAPQPGVVQTAEAPAVTAEVQASTPPAGTVVRPRPGQPVPLHPTPKIGEHVPVAAAGVVPPREQAPMMRTTGAVGLRNENQPYDIENAALETSEGNARVPGPEAVAKPSTEIKALLVDVSEIANRMAWTMAEEKLKQKKLNPVKGEGIVNWMKNKKNAIVNGLSEHRWRVQFYKEALAEINADNNLLKAIEGRAQGVEGMTSHNLGTLDERKSDYYKILDSVMEQYKEDVVRTETEVGKELKDNTEVKAEFAKLVYYNTFNKWSEVPDADISRLTGREAFELYVKKYIADKIRQTNGQDFTTDKDRQGDAKGRLYASNFYEIANLWKDYVQQEARTITQEAGPEHAKAIQDHIAGMVKLDLQLGLKERDLQNNKPKGILNVYEKAVNWAEGATTTHPTVLSKSKRVLGRIMMNPLVLGAASSLGSQAVTRAGRYALLGGAAAFGTATGFWIPLGVGAAIGGARMYYKRSKDVKYDIAQERRHETLGGSGSSILDQRGGLRYSDTMSYKDAIDRVVSINGRQELSDADKNALAEIWARMNIGRQKNIDFFTLSEEEGVKFGTTEVAKTELLKAMKRVMGEAGLTNTDLNKFALVAQKDILEHVEGTDTLESKFRRSESWKAFRKGALMGIAGGVIIHGISEFAQTGDVYGIGAGYHKGMDYLHGSSPTPHVHVPGHAPDIMPHTPSSPPDLNNPTYWQQHGFSVERFHQDMHHGLINEDFPGTGHHAGMEMMGQVHTDGSGNIDADFHKMLENIKTNVRGDWYGESPDGTLDPRFGHLLKDFVGDQNNPVDLNEFANHVHEHLKLVVYPTESMAHAHQGFEIGSPDASGHLHIPDQFKQFFDAAGRPRDGVVMAWGSKGSDNVLHILASVKGHGTPLEAVAGNGLVYKPDSLANEVAAPGPVKPPTIEMQQQGYYDPAIATVPWGRKLYHRKGEKGYNKEQKALKDAEEKRLKKLEKKNKPKAAPGGHDHGHAAEHAAGGGEPKPKHEETKKTKQQENREQLQKEFTEAKAQVDKYRDKKEIKKLKEEFEALSKKEQEDAKVNMAIIKYRDVGEKDKWFRRGEVTDDKKDAAVRGLGFEAGNSVPSLNEFISEVKKMEKAVAKHKEIIEKQKATQAAEVDKKAEAAGKDHKKIVDLKASKDKKDDFEKAKEKFEKDYGVKWSEDFDQAKYAEKLKAGIKVEGGGEDAENVKPTKRENYLKQKAKLEQEYKGVKLQLSKDVFDLEEDEFEHVLKSVAKGVKEAAKERKKILSEDGKKLEIKVITSSNKNFDWDHAFDKGNNILQVPYDVRPYQLVDVLRENLPKDKQKTKTNKNTRGNSEADEDSDDDAESKAA